MGPSVIVTSSKELDFREKHGLLLKSSSGIMPEACVVFGCSRIADPQRGIGLYRIRIFDDPREESIKEDGNGRTLSSRGELNESQRSRAHHFQGEFLQTYF